MRSELDWRNVADAYVDWANRVGCPFDPVMPASRTSSRTAPREAECAIRSTVVRTGWPADR